jgi:hypothetical protein
MCLCSSHYAEVEVCREAMTPVHRGGDWKETGHDRNWQVSTDTHISSLPQEAGWVCLDRQRAQRKAQLPASVARELGRVPVLAMELTVSYNCWVVTNI